MSTQNLYESIYGGFIYNHAKLETTPMSLNGDWISQLWYVYALEYQSATNREKPLIPTAWMNFRGILQSKRNQAQKAVLCTIPSTCHSGKNKL